MRNEKWLLSVILAAAVLAMSGNQGAVFAQGESPQELEERIERLEKQVNQLAERERPEMERPMHPPRGPEMGGRRGPPPVVQVVWPGPAGKAVFWRAVRVLKCAAWTLIACHILLAVWVFTDVRKRGEGHGIFIALALLGGFPATIIYALVRIGDKKT